MKQQHGLYRVFILLITTPLIVGCGLFNPEADIDLDIVTDRTTYTPKDTIEVTIRNTGSETVYYNACQQVVLIALQEEKVVERTYFGVLLCYNPTAFASDEQTVSDFPYDFIAEYAQHCTTRAIDQYRLYFEFYHENELKNLILSLQSQSNAFSLDSLTLKQE